jgi:hypothetical protein
MLDHITSLFYMTTHWWWFAKCSIEGRDDEVHRLSSIIYSSRRILYTPVVVIWGPPGVGKTALVEQVYSEFVLNRLATHQQFVLFGWVQLPNPFNLTGFCQTLLSVLRPDLPPSPDPIQHCSHLVCNYPCLVVIDGLQSMEIFWELANARLIYGNPNSCIVLITTENSVVTSMKSILRQDAMFQVKPLDRKNASDLFRQVSLLSSCIRQPSLLRGNFPYVLIYPFLLTQLFP